MLEERVRTDYKPRGSIICPDALLVQYNISNPTCDRKFLSTCNINMLQERVWTDYKPSGSIICPDALFVQYNISNPTCDGKFL